MVISGKVKGFGKIDIAHCFNVEPENGSTGWGPCDISQVGGGVGKCRSYIGVKLIGFQNR